MSKLRVNIQNVTFNRNHFQINDEDGKAKVPYTLYRGQNNKIDKHSSGYFFDYCDKDIVVLHYCENCSAELYAHWVYPHINYWKDNPNIETYNIPSETLHKWENCYNKLIEDLKLIYKDIKRVIHIDICPICGAHLTETDYFTRPYFNYGENIDLSKALYPDDLQGIISTKNSSEYNDMLSNYSAELYRKANASINDIFSAQKIWTIWSTYSGYDIDETINFSFEDLQQKYGTFSNKIHKTAEKKLEEKYQEYDITPSTPCSFDNKEKICNDLKQYILNLINIENNIFSLKERLSNLYLSYFSSKHYSDIETYNLNKDKTISIENLEKEIDNIDKSIFLIKNSKPISFDYYKTDLVNKNELVYPSAPIMPQQPVLEKAGLFNKKKTEETNAEKMKMFEHQMDAYITSNRLYLEAVKQYDADVEKKYSEFLDVQTKNNSRQIEILNIKKQEIINKKSKLCENNDIISNECIICSILQQEITEAEDILKKLYLCRNQLYGYDIIYMKYRDAVALSSFYEYFESGRCNTLEGTNGAYSIYENECRSNLIISQLSNVIDSLEEIKNNQFLIYQELKSINKNITKLNNKMSEAVTAIRAIENNTSDIASHIKRVSENSDVIAYNTERTAYYSQINAQLTNSLGYMVAFK